MGLRPVDNNQSTRFTSYSFNGANEGFNNEFNLDIETLFFEGDLGSLFPNLDKAGIKPIDYGFYSWTTAHYFSGRDSYQ